MTDPTCTRVRLDPCHFLSRFFEIETLVNDCTGVRLDPSNMKLAFDLFFGLCWTKWGAGQMCSSLTTFLADASSIVHSDALLQMLKRGGETTGAFPNVQIWTMHPTVIQIERSLLHERVNKKNFSFKQASGRRSQAGQGFSRLSTILQLKETTGWLTG